MSEEIDALADGFFSAFRSGHVFLYAGQGASRQEIQDRIADQPWSAVFTTNQDPEFATWFATSQREPQEVSSWRELAVLKPSRLHLPVIRLLGTKGQATPTQDDAPSFLADDAEMQIDNAKELIKAIPSLMDFVNTVVVLGIDSKGDLPLMRTLFRVLHDEAVPGAVSFWGVKGEGSENPGLMGDVAALCERKSFPLHSASLAEVLESRDMQMLDLEEEPDVLAGEGDVFFRRTDPVRISRATLQEIERVGTLLTERSVYRIQPTERSQQRLWFSRFLELTGERVPQWYGYHPGSDFHVQRDYEEPLYQLTKKALDGRGILDDAPDGCPIILSGDPGSSKSVSLGALAFRIFREGVHPVLFLTDRAFRGVGVSEQHSDVINALEAIQGTGDENVPVLLIWDGSAYREIEREASALLRRLRNRGRRVVLVCSSYRLIDDSDDGEHYALSPEQGKFVRGEKCSAHVTRHDHGLVVHATREMSEHEIEAFWQKIEAFAGLDRTQVRWLRKHFTNEGDRDIFSHIYYILALLRQKLEGSLEHERIAVTRFLQAAIPDLFKRSDQRREAERALNPMWRAFVDAGMTPDQLSELGVPKADPGEDAWEEMLTRANAFIALFSRYKIDVPYGFIFSLIMEERDDGVYGQDGQEIFRVLTTDVPWLSCGENDDEEYVFRFRNTIEADIFLDRESISGERLVDMVVSIIRSFIGDHRLYRSPNPRIATRIQSLIRLIGPNSKYYASHPQDATEHQDILRHLDRIIDALDDLLFVERIPDDDGGFSFLYITLTREYYGSNVWNRMHGTEEQTIPYGADGFTAGDYEQRLEKLRHVTRLAYDMSLQMTQRSQLSMDERERRFLQRQSNGFTIETAHCTLEMSRLSQQYERLREAEQQEPLGKAFDDVIAYHTQFERLSAVIRSDPTNGYAYNAVFSLFEREYGREGLSRGQQIEYLTDVMSLVDECVALNDEIEGRGQRSDEISRHVSTIASIADRIPISMRDFEQKDGRDAHSEASVFMDVYERYLALGNPAAILFICQKELKGLSEVDGRLTVEAVRRCVRTLAFMKNPKRFECICGDSNALATLIRVAWMAFNGSKLNPSRECQCTFLSSGQWRELHSYCKRYAEAALPSEQQPILLLLYALSTVQVAERDKSGYERAYAILQSIEENRFMRQTRMRTPFIVCESDGEPVLYQGKVEEANERTGTISVYGLPRFGRHPGVRFYRANFGRNAKMPAKGSIVSDLQVGIGYTSFSLYKEAGAAERRARR